MEKRTIQGLKFIEPKYIFIFFSFSLMMIILLPIIFFDNEFVNLIPVVYGIWFVSVGLVGYIYYKIVNKYFFVSTDRNFWIKEEANTYVVYKSCWRSKGPYLEIVLPIVQKSEKNEIFQNYNFELSYTKGSLRYIIPVEIKVSFLDYYCFDVILANFGFNAKFINMEAEIKQRLLDKFYVFVKRLLPLDSNSIDWLNLHNNLNNSYIQSHRLDSTNQLLFGGSIIISTVIFQQVKVEMNR